MPLWPLLLFLFLLRVFPSLANDEHNKFYGIITPALSAQWQVEVECLQGCKHFPSVVLANVTPRHQQREAGTFAFNLAPLLSKRDNFSPMKALRVSIRSVHKLADQNRSNSWTVKGPVLGSALYHFQFGHFEVPSRKQPLHLNIKFTRSLKEPKARHKYMLAVRDKHGNPLAEDQELDEQEWGGGTLNAIRVPLDSRRFVLYLRANTNPSIHFAIRKESEDQCTICLTGDGMKKLTKCDHHFHQECIDNWANELTKKAGKCPICDVGMEFVKTNRQANDGRRQVKMREDPMKPIYQFTVQKPILQNGKKPHFTHQVDPTKKWRSPIPFLLDFFQFKNQNLVEKLNKPQGKSAATILAELITDNNNEGNLDGKREVEVRRPTTATAAQGVGSNQSPQSTNQHAGPGEAEGGGRSNTGTVGRSVPGVNADNADEEEEDEWVRNYAQEWDGEDEEAYLHRIQAQLNSEHGSTGGGGGRSGHATGPAAPQPRRQFTGATNWHETAGRGEPRQSGPQGAAHFGGGGGDEDDIQRAMQASLQTGEEEDVKRAMRESMKEAAAGQPVVREFNYFPREEKIPPTTAGHYDFDEESDHETYYQQQSCPDGNCDFQHHPGDFYYHN